MLQHGIQVCINAEMPFIALGLTVKFSLRKAMYCLQGNVPNFNDQHTNAAVNPLFNVRQSSTDVGRLYYLDLCSSQHLTGGFTTLITYVFSSILVGSLTSYSSQCDQFPPAPGVFLEM